MTDRTTAPAAAAGLDAAQTIQSLDAAFRRGPQTSEFYLAIATWVLPILTLIWHKDLSSLAVPLSAVAAGIANGAYAISRAVTKNSHASAVAAVGTAAAAPTSTSVTAAPAASTVDIDDVATWAASMAGAISALTAALNTAITIATGATAAASSNDAAQHHSSAAPAAHPGPLAEPAPPAHDPASAAPPH